MKYPLLILTVFAAAAPRVQADEPIQFSRDIRPILSEKCFFCHGPDANHREADLRLDIETDAKEYAIVDGQADESEFFSRLLTEDPEERMPPLESGRSLTADQIELLRSWIDQGAPYAGHWAFTPPHRSEPPVVSDASWAIHPIDRFVLAGLDQENRNGQSKWRPAPEADRHTLIRRVSLDLIGLPPTIDEIAAFVADKSPDAYEKVVDRLLRSDRYGEHMARYWMDAARYADTNGYQYDLEREQWVWRDWVIHAYNSNMPFDQFTIEQIAGDLLPDATDLQRLATGFHRNHPITIEGGVIDEEYRTEYVVDRVVTTSTVWMGLTMMCGRCHDHKYDPVSQREFYRFFAFFNNISERGLKGFDPKRKIPSPLLKNESDAFDEQISVARSRYEQLADEAGLSLEMLEQQAIETSGKAWEVVAPSTMKSVGGATLTLQDDQSILASGNNPATETYELILRTDLESVSAVRLESLVDPSTVNGGTGRGSNGNFVLSEFEVEVASPDQPDEFQKVKLSDAEADYSQNKFDVQLAIDGKVDRTGWAVDGNSKIENRTAVFRFRRSVGDDSGTILRIRMIHKYGGSHHIARFRLAIAKSDVPPMSMSLASIFAKPAATRSSGEAKQVRDWLLVQFASDKVKRVAEELHSLVEQRDKLVAGVPATMVMAELPDPRPTHVLIRGEYDNPGDQVSSGTPAALPPIPDGLPRNRLGLAKWLVMPEHPLTARVTVNRLWQQLFGSGIVKTTEDFGSQGDWPSHPELLDWLAVEFVESGWDVKALLKQIVMSATYRQSSLQSEDLRQADPDNRLLARGPRLRLDAEVIRDSALWASGLLHPSVGGPSVFPYHPTGLWQEINNRPGFSRTYKQDLGEKLYRRSLYTFWKRTVPPPSMATFDAPEREFCVVRRSRTNTPLQAFVMLHDPQFVEAARRLATRIMTEGGASTRPRIVYGFQLCHSREPTPEEIDVLTETFDVRLAQYRGDNDAATRLLSVGDWPVDPTADAAELAAWTTIGRILLNLSEFVTKP